MRIILPKTSVNPGFYQNKRNLFFLAGPVRGGGDWQYRMCLELDALMPNCIIAVPQRYDESHPLQEFRIPKSEDPDFPRQLAWEAYYLNAASRSGGIIFWYGCESKTDPHPGPDYYSQQTRDETGEWRTHKQYRPNDVRLFMGAEEEYRGLDELKWNCARQLGTKFPIYSTMRDVATAATR